MTDTTEIRRQVVHAGRVLEVAGIGEFVWGHVSLRDPEGRGVWMKRSGLGFDELGEDDVLLVSPDGEVLEGDGPRHAEYPIHTEILRARPELASVVHVHPPHAIALGASRVALQPFSHIGGVFADGLRRYDAAAGLVQTRQEGAALAAALGGDRALLLTGHGVITVGASIGVAVAAAVMLERACRLQLLAEGFGGVAAPLPADQARTVYAHTLSDSYLDAAWQYLSRRVRRTCPTD